MKKIERFISFKNLECLIGIEHVNTLEEFYNKPNIDKKSIRLANFTRAKKLRYYNRSKLAILELFSEQYEYYK